MRENLIWLLFVYLLLAKINFGFGMLMLSFGLFLPTPTHTLTCDLFDFYFLFCFYKNLLSFWLASWLFHWTLNTRLLCFPMLDCNCIFAGMLTHMQKRLEEKNICGVTERWQVSCYFNFLDAFRLSWRTRNSPFPRLYFNPEPLTQNGFTVLESKTAN